jgi:hypothetical protein
LLDSSSVPECFCAVSIPGKQLFTKVFLSTNVNEVWVYKWCK